MTIGITDHAQAALGDLVFIELPAVGRKLAAGEACAVVESVKAASDVYAPVAGEVVARQRRASTARPRRSTRTPTRLAVPLKPADAGDARQRCSTPPRYDEAVGDALNGRDDPMQMNDLPRRRAPTLARARGRTAPSSRRHIGTTHDDQAAMLATLGFASRAALIDAIVPAAIRERAPLRARRRR